MKKILLIEDEELIRNSFEIILRKAGYSVFSAANGLESKSLLMENDFDLIITDILMPDSDGIEVIMKVQEEHNHIPIIAISGGGMAAPNDYLNMAKGLGASITLTKPIRAKELKEAVESCLVTA